MNIDENLARKTAKFEVSNTGDREGTKRLRQIAKTS
jgi:hypothetical protein